jgi:hypothetical protein
MASTLKVTDIQHPSSGTPAITVGSNNSVSIVGGALSPQTGFKNRIINGAMVIDQRNNGAAVLNSTGYVVDRWGDFKSGSGAYTAQRSTVAPAGFTNSFQHTVTTAVSPAAGDVYQIIQHIEGFNTADLGFGTASASSVTVSFWVRSSVAGLYSIALQNSAQNRSYVATYTVSSVNTFEYKTITIPGDTTGTWLTNNGVGVTLHFDIGSGSNNNTTAGAWQAGQFRRTSACVNWISTNGATFYITGVQLEKGSVATPFEFRSIGQELALAQRYFEIYRTNAASTSVSVGQAIASTASINVFPFKVQKRASPTFLSTGTWVALNSAAGNAGGTISQNAANEYTARVDINGASGLSAGNASILFCNTNGGTLQFSAEL